MDQALRLPGQTNAWTMPIKARIDMLTTGVRTPVGIKIYGADLAEIERVGSQVEAALRGVPGTRSAFAERAAGGYFVDLDLRRDEIARYGLSVAAVQDVVMSAIGGENVTTTIEGRARFPVNVRYPRDLRSDLETLGRVLVDDPFRGPDPARPGRGHPHRHRPRHDPQRERPPRGLRLRGHPGRDVGGYVEDAKRAVAAAVKLPSGYAARVERPVREHAAGHGAAEARRAVHARADPLPALRQHEVAREDR